MGKKCARAIGGGAGEARARWGEGGDFATSRLGVYRGVTLFGRARGGRAARTRARWTTTDDAPGAMLNDR